MRYRLCNQTVTVYHHEKESGIYTRTVLEKRAFFDMKKTQNIDKTGSKEVNSFLLVVPCDEQIVFVGDKVMHGVGSEVNTREEWSGLIPSKVPGLVTVSYVDPKFKNDQMVHLEAGG